MAWKKPGKCSRDFEFVSGRIADSLEPKGRIYPSLASDKSTIGRRVQLSDILVKLSPLDLSFDTDPIQRLVNPAESSEGSSAGPALDQELPDDRLLRAGNPTLAEVALALPRIRKRRQLYSVLSSQFCNRDAFLVWLFAENVDDNCFESPLMSNGSLDLLGGSRPTRNQNPRKLDFPVTILKEDALC
jgi:hypothetical protein